MPVISMFYGILISMYYFDNKQHKLPHLHARFGESESVFALESGEEIEGNLPPKKVKLVEAWIEIHRSLHLFSLFYLSGENGSLFCNTLC